jgi:hypothetical protein
MSYFVSRQMYWPDGDAVVEIAVGGSDVSGCDMLVAKYAGEGEEYADPREALQAAVDIREAWKQDARKRENGEWISEVNADEIRIEAGSGMDVQGGYDFPENEELRSWAEKELERLPKCDRCGEIIEDKKKVTLWDYDDSAFCCEGCAERFQEERELERRKAELTQCPQCGSVNLVFQENQATAYQYRQDIQGIDSEPSEDLLDPEETLFCRCRDCKHIWDMKETRIHDLPGFPPED